MSVTAINLPFDVIKLAFLQIVDNDFWQWLKGLMSVTAINLPFDVIKLAFLQLVVLTIQRLGCFDKVSMVESTHDTRGTIRHSKAHRPSSQKLSAPAGQSKRTVELPPGTHRRILQKEFAYEHFHDFVSCTVGAHKQCCQLEQVPQLSKPSGSPIQPIPTEVASLNL
jgi:hypothetical protein